MLIEMRGSHFSTSVMPKGSLHGIVLPRKSGGPDVDAPVSSNEQLDTVEEGVVEIGRDDVGADNVIETVLDDKSEAPPAVAESVVEPILKKDVEKEVKKDISLKPSTDDVLLSVEKNADKKVDQDIVNKKNEKKDKDTDKSAKKTGKKDAEKKDSTKTESGNKDKKKKKEVDSKKISKNITQKNKTVSISSGSSRTGSKSSTLSKSGKGISGSSQAKEVLNILNTSNYGSAFGELDAELGQLYAGNLLMDDAIAQMKSHIAAFWVLPTLPAPGSFVTLQIRLNNRGELLSAKKIASSGSSLLDEAAKIAVEAASPFPMPNDADVKQAFLDWELTLRPEELQ